jgi:anti-sigma B factor antagonist
MEADVSTDLGIDAGIGTGVEIVAGAVAVPSSTTPSSIPSSTPSSPSPLARGRDDSRASGPAADPADEPISDRHAAVRIDVARPGRTVLLAGRLDVSTVADVRLALHDAVDRGSADLLVDLAGVEFVDASGLGVLVGTHRRAGRAGRRLVLRNVPDRVLRLLALTRLNRVLHVEELRPPPLVAAG